MKKKKKKKKRNPEQTELVKEEEEEKKNRPANPGEERKKKKSQKVVKSYGWVLFVGPLCVFNYNIAIELWVMETENSFMEMSFQFP